MSLRNQALLIWRRGQVKKSIAAVLQTQSEIGESETTLKKSLSAFDLVCFGIGCIIGTGVFVLTGTVAATSTGPALVLSMLIAAVCSALCGLCYAELASIVPVSGSAYTYSYSALGELWGWIIGWDLILEYGLAVATVAVGWSGYCLQLLYSMGIKFPLSLAGAPGTSVEVSATISGTGGFNLLAFLITLIVTAVVLCFGIKESSRANVVVVVLKVTVLLLFIFTGFAYINGDNYVPFLPPNKGEFGAFGFSGVLQGAGKIFFAYIGFDSVSTAAQESLNPQRDLPIGILGSLAISTVLYIATSLVLTGMLPYYMLNVAHPLSFAMEQHAVSWLTPIISVGALCGLTSVMLVSLLGQTRIFYSMSTDGLLPRLFSQLHPKYQTPFTSTVLTGSITAVISGLIPLEILSEMTSMGTLLAFTMVCVGVVILRSTEPDLPRAFKVPYMPYIPICGALICLIQMIFLGWGTWVRLIVWLTIGLILYGAYGHKRAHGSRTMPDTCVYEADRNGVEFQIIDDTQSHPVIREATDSIGEARSIEIPTNNDIKNAIRENDLKEASTDLLLKTKDDILI